MSHPNYSTASTSRSPIPARLEPEQFEALWKTCTVNEPSKIDAYLSSLPSAVQRSAEFRECLSVAISHGPHYDTMQHLITRYNAKVDGWMLVKAVNLALPSTERMALLDFLFREGNIDVNAQVDGWNTLLLHCIREKDMAEYLLERGANPNMGPAISAPIGMWGADELVYDSGSILATAVARRSGEVIDLLVQHGALLKSANTVHNAIQRGDQSVLLKVLALGADVNETDSYALFGRGCMGSPLVRAIKQAQTDMVEILLERGADISFIDGKGESILDLVGKDGVHPGIRALIYGRYQKSRDASAKT